MKTHVAVTGIEIEYDPDPQTEAFLAEVARRVANPKLKENDIIGFAYGPENPILFQEPNGRSLVTRAVLDNPSYRVLGDLLFRKRIAQFGKTPEQIADSYTLTVTEAAERLGLTPDAVRKQIREHKLSAWKKGDEYFLDPKLLELVQKGAERGPTSPLLGLHCAAGKGDKAFFFVKAPGRTEPIGHKGNELVTIRKWRSVGIYSGGDGRSRFIEIENNPQARESPEHVGFREWTVDGPFRVVRKVNNAAEARKAWEAFRAS
jgi:excisionase family DNA binding protein